MTLIDTPATTKPISRPLSAVVLGAGNRGSVYGQFAMTYPHEMQVVAVAEPEANRRAQFAGAHDLPPEACFESWQDLMRVGKTADVLINCTQDRMHTESTLSALEAGYDVLLEKPMSPVLHENVRLVQAAEDLGRTLQICHVLRYSPYFRKIREIVQSGRLGRIISVDHRENLVFWHMAHSFVRGNWRNLEESAPMILAKCCHDFDILGWILRQPVTKLQSFGSLTWFKPENAPDGATMRCTDGCPAAEDCKYYAPRIYLNPDHHFARRAASLDMSDDAMMEALRTGPYGRCVYHCDNDVVDHQTVNMELADGTTVVLTMQGQGNYEGRSMRYDGTDATLYGKFSAGDNRITIHDHLTGRVEHVEVINRDNSGHGGGDYGIVRSFVNAVNGFADDSITTARVSLESHLLAFAAEESRHTNTVIDMESYRARAEAEARAIYG
jgi:predicted dehydrogenase